MGLLPQYIEEIYLKKAIHTFALKRFSLCWKMKNRSEISFLMGSKLPLLSWPSAPNAAFPFTSSFNRKNVLRSCLEQIVAWMGTKIEAENYFLIICFLLRIMTGFVFYSHTYIMNLDFLENCSFQDPLSVFNYSYYSSLYSKWKDFTERTSKFILF